MPRPDVSAERRTQILQAAVQVFSKRGFANARMDDIVQESGLSKGALYWYFKSKDEIITALMEQFYGDYLDAAILDQPGTVTERLKVMLEQIMGGASQSMLLLPITLEFYANVPRRADMGAFFQRMFAAYRDLLEQLLQQGVARGEFPQTTDPQQVAQALIGLFEGTAIIGLLQGQTADQIAQQLAAGTRLLLAGLKNLDE
ncbi:MAG: TetR/AcrR family transcriptional regulator [Chloroflexales bacterium]|nr:TetR/AcrR family transcriptional regulator [Chloroflexales bacterium]